MSSLLRWLWPLGGAVAVVAAACSDFDTNPEPVSDAGVDAAADASDAGLPPAPPDADVEDAGPCAACRSAQCYDDGGCFPVVFVTKELYPGNFNQDGGGVARGDAVCNLAGNADAAVPTQWRAWLSDHAEGAISHVTDGFPGGASRPVVDTQGVRVANSYLELVKPDGGLLAPIRATQNRGVAGDGDHVWTGTTPAGIRSENAANQCQDWTAGNGFSGRSGKVGATNGQWTDFADDQCQNRGHLYCFEVIP